jgi:hypothetical protein
MKRRVAADAATVVEEPEHLLNMEWPTSSPNRPPVVT